MSFTLRQIEKTRQALTQSLADYFHRHQVSVGLRKDPLSDAIQQTPMMAVEAEVGIGKSHVVAVDVLKCCFNTFTPVVVLVPTHQLAQEYFEKARSAGVPAEVYRGREATPVDAAPDEISPWACFNKKAVERGAAKAHRPANSVCRQCKHGRKAALDGADLETQAEHYTWFESNGFSLDEIEAIQPCRFLYEGLPAQLQARILIAPVQAFSEALSVHIDELGGRTQRLIIADEGVDLAEQIQVTVSDIDQWRERIADIYVRKLDRAGRIGDPYLKEQMETEAEALNAVSGLFGEVSACLSLGKKPGKDLSDRIVAAYRLLKKTGLNNAGTAHFEAVTFDKDIEDLVIPLRGFTALAAGCKANRVRLSKNKRAYRLYALKPLLEWALTKGSTAFLDATLDSVLRDVITAQGGEVFRAKVKQNMRVIRYRGFIYGIGKKKGEALSNYTYTAQARIREMRAVIADMPKPCAVLGQKAWFTHAWSDPSDPDAAEKMRQQIEAETGQKVGWWGAHERGHNDWAGHHIALLGMPILSGEGIESQWSQRQCLALRAGMDLADWPADYEDGTVFPEDPTQNRWIAQFYAGFIVQAVGRARALHAEETIEVRLYGGIQKPELDRALAENGIVIDEYRDDNVHAACKLKTGPKVDADICQRGIEALEAVGGRISVRQLEDAIHGLGGKASKQRVMAAVKAYKEHQKKRSEFSIEEGFYMENSEHFQKPDTDTEIGDNFEVPESPYWPIGNETAAKTSDSEPGSASEKDIEQPQGLETVPDRKGQVAQGCTIDDILAEAANDRAMDRQNAGDDTWGDEWFEVERWE